MSELGEPHNGPLMAECCADPDNLEVDPVERADLTIRVCQVCGRRHFEVDAEPFQIGVEFKE